MKGMIKIIGIIAMVVVIGLFTACDDGNGGNKGSTNLTGTWKASGERIIIFTATTFDYKVNDVTEYSGTYSTSGSKITFNESLLGTASGNFSVSGNTLTLSNHTWDSSVNGAYTKDTGNNNQTVNVINGNTLAEKLAWVSTNAQSNTDYIIEVSADEAITPHSLSYFGKNDIRVKLIGSGGEKKISLSSIGTLFSISNGVTLILDNNITLQGRADNTSNLVYVSSNCALIMNTGSKIIGNTYNSSSSPRGGAVQVAGTFTMNGGEISGNIAASPEMYPRGGAVCVSGSGTFIMNNGKILNNKALTGGGVYVMGGSFTMNGGEITNNEATSNGGGVQVYEGIFTMSGTAKISGNTSSGHGGGVHLEDDDIGVQFFMSGGEISNNTANVHGGGVYIIKDGSFNMTGGTISGNTAICTGTFGSGGGGGVYIASGGSFSKSGSSIIYGNNASTNSNNGTNYGHAVYWQLYDGSYNNISRYCNTTLNTSENISTDDPSTGWTPIN